MRTENWQHYFCNINDSLSSVFVDLALKDLAPISRQAQLAWIMIKLREPREDGLSSDQEFEALISYEDVLESRAMELNGATYAGRITRAGRREFYFYCDDPHRLGQLFSEVVSKFPEYLFQTGHKADLEWSHYREVLYPGPHGLEQIQAREGIV